METKNESKKMTGTKNTRSIVMGLCIVIVAMLIFQAGVFIGIRKAGFSYGFGENYYRAFGDHRMGGMMGFFGDDVPGGHGVVGKIIKISLPTLVVEGTDNLEKVIVVDNSTQVRNFRDIAQPTDLKVDDSVIILGSPNSAGQIVAKLIRVMPTQMMGTSTTPTFNTPAY